MKSKKVTIPVEISIWAVPLQDYETQPEYHPFPFTYRFFTKGTRPYHHGAVLVEEQMHDITVPEGINLVEKAVDAIQDEIDALETEFHEAKSVLVQKLRDLQMLEAPTGN